LKNTRNQLIKRRPYFPARLFEMDDVKEGGNLFWGKEPRSLREEERR